MYSYAKYTSVIPLSTSVKFMVLMRSNSWECRSFLKLSSLSPTAQYLTGTDHLLSTCKFLDYKRKTVCSYGDSCLSNPVSMQLYQFCFSVHLLSLSLVLYVNRGWKNKTKKNYTQVYLTAFEIALVLFTWLFYIISTQRRNTTWLNLNFLSMVIFSCPTKT